MSLTAPVNGATIAFGGDVMLTANASDFDGAVTKVEFMEGSNKLGENSAEPYQFTWVKPPVGSYTLTARSTDNRGAVTVSSPVTITVSTVNEPPTVSLSHPVEGASIQLGAFISISAVAGDIDGSVSKVEFFAGNDKIGESLSPTSPYTIPWSASLVGPYRFTAVAHDNLGASASSMPVFVSVINTLPGGTLNLQDGINGYTGTSDTYLSTNHSTINFGFRTQLLSDSFRYTKLIRFSIFESDGGPVPDGATIQFARLSMYKLSSYDHTYRAHRMLVDWDEAEATWEQRLTGVAWSSPGGNNPTSDYFSTADGEASIGSSPGWLEIDVTASVQQMATGQPNYGWRLVPVTGNNNLKRFYTREFSTDPLLRPKLTIGYTSP